MGICIEIEKMYVYDHGRIKREYFMEFHDIKHMMMYRNKSDTIIHRRYRVYQVDSSKKYIQIVERDLPPRGLPQLVPY